ncbi:MAG: hypothetical protein GY810_01295 [Aureispira sp.]|nr:hypothetical protein [Aureispira sp.]
MKGLGVLIVWMLSLTLGQQLTAQYYIAAGYAHGFSNMPTTTSIISDFNARENHTLGKMQGLDGYQFAAGMYSDFMMVELGYGNMVKGLKSTNPNQLKENAQVIANQAAVHFNIGYRPFKFHYFTVGGGLTLGQARVRYSFGGDYQAPVKQYNFGAELFVDYGIRLKFLLKKSQRKQLFYLLRIHPYYQFTTGLELRKLETELNQRTELPEGQYFDNMGHFGIRISLVVPFLPKDEQERRKYFEKPKKKKKKKKPKTSQRRKGGTEEPKGRL